ncbi:hypothetical protein, partial [Roseiarcus sp.]|uniref:hypothetical protein n=1 Tax=Roseiarcus sp. TaxID=1969460 RepID=UPI003C50F5C0
KRVAHIPTAEAARSGLILEGQGQARSHLKSNVPWSHKWGPVHQFIRGIDVLKRDVNVIGVARVSRGEIGRGIKRIEEASVRREEEGYRGAAA